jgi:YD repeat-containing protein
MLNGASIPANSWTDTGIVFTVPVGASSGLLGISVAPSMNASNAVHLAVTAQPLPSGWSDLDLGITGMAGSATYNCGTFTVSGAGSIGGTADKLHFVYQSLVGDGSIVARVNTIQNGTGFPQVGAMIRESLTSGSAATFMYFSPSQAVLLVRSSTGASITTQSTGFSAQATPYWVKFTRSGNVFAAYVGSDGFNWTQVGTNTTVPMAQTVYIGLGVTSGNTTSIATAAFDNVSVSSNGSPAPIITGVSATTGSVGSQVQITGMHFGAPGASVVTLHGAIVPINLWTDTSIVFTIPSGATSGFLVVSVAPTMNDSNPVQFAVTTQPLPNPWLDQDVGATGMTGSATYSAGTFSVSGAGQVGGTADKLHFVYQPLLGDGSIVARVASIQNGTGFSQVGVMIRETLNPNASTALVIFSPSTATFRVRSSTGASMATQSTSFGGPATPYWVRIIRTASSFSAYISSNGTAWTQVGTSTTITMGQNAFIGLAVTSGNTTSIASATFDNVSVVDGTAPFVSSVSPLVGGVGTSVTITGSNFGSSQGSSSVKFNGVAAATITSWNDSQIVANVPSTIIPGTGPVTVTVNSIVSNGNIAFTAYHPIITAINPPGAAVGATVTITGSGFGGYFPTVSFNGVSGFLTSAATDTTVSVLIPGGATTGPVTVSNNGFPSDGFPFTIEGTPTVSTLSPDTGLIGSQVTISGSGFGAVQSNSSIDFNGVIATSITSWSDTSIQATVPVGAPTGPVSVTVGGLSGAGPSFNVIFKTTLTNSLGYTSHYTASQYGGQWFVTDADGGGCSSCTLRGVVHNSYDSAGNLLSSTDELGRVTSYTYDPNTNDMLSKTVGPDTNGQYATTSFTYNTFGEVLTATDPMGKVTTNTYDPTNGNLLTTTTPAPDGTHPGSLTQFDYYANGLLYHITDPLNHVTTLTYTSAGLIETVKDAQNNLTTYQYDARGNRTAVIDPINSSAHPTSFTYDGMDRLTRTTYPDATHVDFGYDYRGRRTTVTDQNGKVTTYAYDDEDRLTSVTDAQTPTAGVSSYVYDTENQLQTITDANNHTTTFHYDNFGRVTQTDFPSSLSEHFYYDAVGNLTSKTDRNGHTITYVYDNLNRMTSKSYTNYSAAYSYDLASRLTQVVDPTGTYTFVFDYMGRLVGTSTQYNFVTGPAFANTYTYDAASNRTGMTDPQGAPTTYGYDNLNRLNSLLSPVSTTPSASAMTR